MQHTDNTPHSFKDEVMAEPGGELLQRCYSCGTCVSMCLVNQTCPDYNPRRTMRMVMLDMREETFRNPTIWHCSACDLCHPHCPQGIHISDLMRAIKNVALRAGYESPLPSAKVDEHKCSGCDICEKACPYGALSLAAKTIDGKERKISQVDRSLCMACGICAAACPLSAITVEDYSNEKVAAQIQAGHWLKKAKSGDPKVLVFNCSWNLRAEADRDAMSELPANVRVVNVPCSGRIDPTFVLTALQAGVARVLVAGCQPGECHYKQGTRIAQGRMHTLNHMFEQMGMDAQRVQFVQIGTEDRGRLPATILDLVAELKSSTVAVA
jgi:coenzyme F420-reducing hydrogenase delta subunit/heterodisulfide reductase subunit C